MREIKFRFWNTRNNRWESDPLETSPYYQNPFGNGDLIAMQYTNLKDKNGKDIYEFDILIPVNMCDSNISCWTSRGTETIGIPMEVKWLKTSWDVPIDPENWEIIDNIIIQNF